MFIKAFEAVIEFIECKVIILGINSLELAAIMDIYDLEKSFSPMQNLLNFLKTFVKPFLLSLRESEMVRKSGYSLPTPAK